MLLTVSAVLIHIDTMKSLILKFSSVPTSRTRCRQSKSNAPSTCADDFSGSRSFRIPVIVNLTCVSSMAAAPSFGTCHTPRYALSPDIFHILLIPHSRIAIIHIYRRIIRAGQARYFHPGDEHPRSGGETFYLVG